MKNKPDGLRPMAVYRGQIVVVDRIHDHKSVVTDAQDTQLLVSTRELKTDAASLMAAMRGDS